jgi:hypothetical protein
MNLLKSKTGLFLLAIIVIGVGITAIYFSVAKTPTQRAIKLTPQSIIPGIKVKLLVNDSKTQTTYDKDLPVGSTAFDLLEQSSQTNNFSLSYQQSQMGVFVDEIAGVKNDNSANKFWLYKVNGKLANVGASSYKIKDGDVVEWYYGTVTDFKQ